MPYRNQNLVLGSLDKLNQFLSIEVAKKEKQDKMNKINFASKQIIQNFSKLPDNASASDTQKALLNSWSAAANSGVLPETAQFANTAYLSSLKTIEATKKIKGQEQFKKFAQEAMPYTNFNNVSPEFIPQAAVLARQNLVKTTRVNPDKTSSLVISKLGANPGDTKEVANIPLGGQSSQDALNLYKDKKAIDFGYALSLAKAKNSAKGSSIKASDIKGMVESSANTMKQLAPTLIFSIAGPKAWQAETGYDITKLNANEQSALLRTTLSNPALLEKLYKNGHNSIDYTNASSPSDAVDTMLYGNSQYIDNYGTRRPGTLVPNKDRALFEQFANASQMHSQALGQQANATLSNPGADQQMQNVAWNRANIQVDTAINNWSKLPENTKKAMEASIRYISGDINSAIPDIWTRMSQEKRKEIIMLMTQK